MNVLIPRKMKTKKDKKLIFAGVVYYLAINKLSKCESPIFISSEVMGVKNPTHNAKHTHPTHTRNYVPRSGTNFQYYKSGLSVCLYEWMYVTNVTLRYKSKTKKDKNLDFAGVVYYVTSNNLSKFESPIFISSEVMRVKKKSPNNGKHTHPL